MLGEQQRLLCCRIRSPDHGRDLLSGQGAVAQRTIVDTFVSELVVSRDPELPAPIFGRDRERRGLDHRVVAARVKQSVSRVTLVTHAFSISISG